MECFKKDSRTGDIPDSYTSYIAGRPWLRPSPDRLIKSTIVKPDMVKPDYGTCGPGTISPPDETTGISFLYFWSWTTSPENVTIFVYDFALQPVKEISLNTLVSRLTAASINSVFFINNYDDSIYEGIPGPLAYLDISAKDYSIVNTPNDVADLWIVDTTIWIRTIDDEFYSANKNDVVSSNNWKAANTPKHSLELVSWNNDIDNPEYYYFSKNESDQLFRAKTSDPQTVTLVYDGSDGLASTIAAPDGSVWIVTNLAQGYSVKLLNGPDGTPESDITWYNPFDCNPIGLDEVDIEKIQYFSPLSCTNLIFQYSGNEPTLFRLGVGVADQPALPFPDYTDDSLVAYNSISQQLLDGFYRPDPQSGYDIRSKYGSISSVQASIYFSKMSDLTMPETIDQSVWDSICREISFELYNLTSANSLWEVLNNATLARDSVSSHALNLVDSYLQIPTTAIADEKGTVEGLEIAGAALDTIEDIGLIVAAVLSISNPVAAVVISVSGTVLGLVGGILSFIGSKDEGWDVRVNDIHFVLSIEYSNIESTIGPVFARTLDATNQCKHTVASDLGKLAVSGFQERYYWSTDDYISLTEFKKGDCGDMKKLEETLDPLYGNMSSYYRVCAINYLQGYLPIVSCVAVSKDGISVWGDCYICKGTYGPETVINPADETEYNCQLVQLADVNGDLLGQDIEKLLWGPNGVSVDPVDFYFSLNEWAMKSEYNWKDPRTSGPCV